MSLLEETRKKGWIEIIDVRSEADLFRISNSIGRVIPHPNGELIFKLRPSEGHNSGKNTLSNHYGYGAFPLHTDTAFWDLPARYMILSSIVRSETHTLLFDTQDFIKKLSRIEYNDAQRAIYLLKTNRRQTYTSFIFKENKNTGFRFDLGCMYPLNNAAKMTSERLTNFIIDKNINHYVWNGETAIIIDNWRMMHGRSPANRNEKRELNRIYLTTI